ncbi:MAG: hypothetical protein M5U26_05680 [Planctomycetota bacterium]|nr:hypothetical protein [Planctomycetota bacterium]
MAWALLAGAGFGAAGFLAAFPFFAAERVATFFPGCFFLAILHSFQHGTLTEPSYNPLAVKERPRNAWASVTAEPEPQSADQNEV